LLIAAEAAGRPVVIALRGGTTPGARFDDIAWLTASLAPGGRAPGRKASSALIARRAPHSSVANCFCRGTRDFI
jgi:hypothetical protein